MATSSSQITSDEMGLLPIRITPLLPLKISEKQIAKLENAKVTKKRPNNSGSDKFTKNQLAFINFYCQGMAAKAAHIAAGYSVNSDPYALLYTPHVWAEVQHILRLQFEQHQITTDEIHEGFAREMRANLADYGEVQGDGTFRIDLRNITREQFLCIEEYGFDANGRPRIRLANKQLARTTLARLRGLFTEKHEIVGRDVPLTLQALDSIVINTTINQQINISATQERQQLPENIDTSNILESESLRPALDTHESQ